MPAGYLMEAEAAKRFRRVLPVVIAVESFEAAVAEYFKELEAVLGAAVVLEAVAVEATTVQGVVNKPIMPKYILSPFNGNE
jgi:hypothetical protein